MTICPHESSYLSPFVRLVCLKDILSPVLHSLQEIHLFQVTAPTPIGIKLVFNITRRNVRAPVHGRFVEGSNLLGLLSGYVC